jgi:tetratricopeptide (TPR) repeat protein
MPDPEILKIGKYEVQAELGQGGFGKVYRAFDPTVGRPVAIKILTTDGNRDLLTRFRNEASAAGKLKHKNIVTIHEFGEHNGRPFLVMELLEGQDLLQIIKDGVHLTLLQKMNIMDQVAEGLDCAHGNGVIHRDIKPANIRLLPDGTVKIMDFGVARMNRDRNETGLTQQGDLIGTILYMSPEQFAGSVADVLSDIFAYGVTYYELLTGKHPFKETDPARVMFKISMEDPAPLRSLVPECPQGLEDVIGRALQKDRELRYQGLRDLRLDTEPLLFELEQDRARALVVEAQKQSDAGDFTSALSIIHEAMNLDPGNRDLRQLREAVQRELQKQAIESRVKAMLRTAEEQLARREFAPAIQTLELALKLDQTNLHTREQLEAARTQMQRFKDATRLVAAAQQDLRKGEFGAAVEKCSEAARLDPVNTEAPRILAEARQQLFIRDRLQEIDAMRARGDIDSYVRELTELASSHPDSREVNRVLKEALSLQATEERIRAVLAAAEERIHQSSFGDAIDGLAVALNEFPKEPRIMALLSQAKEDLRALGRAQEIEKAAHNAEAMSAARNFAGSLQEIDGALLRFPNDVRLTELRGTVSAAKSAWDRDLEVKKTVEHCNRLRASHRLAEALEALQAGLVQYKQEPALVSLEREVREQWELEQRAEAVRRSLEEGQGLLDRGRTDLAVEALEKSYGQYPESGELQKLVVHAQQRRQSVEQVALEAQKSTEQQDFERAARILQQALKSWPRESRLEELHKSTAAARASWQRDQAIHELARECSQLQASHRLAEALELIAGGLKRFEQEPILLRLEQEVREQWELEQEAEAARRNAQQLLDEGRFQQAVELLDEACGRYPAASDLPLLLSRAKEELRAQQQREVIEQSALEAQGWAEQKDFARAFEILEKALQSWPGESRLVELVRKTTVARTAWETDQAIDAVVRECNQLRSSHRSAEALEAVQAGLRKYQQAPALVALEKEVREEWERQQRAEAIARSAEEGQRLLDDGRFQQAVQTLEKAREQYRDESQLQALLNRAKEELREQQRREAVEQVAREAQHSTEQRDFERAVQILQQALGSWPGDARLEGLVQANAAARASWQKEQAIQELARQCSQFQASHRLTEALELIAAGLKKYEQEPVLLQLEQEVREQWEREQEVEAARRNAQRLLDEGRFQQAVELLDQACGQYPAASDLPPLLNRAKEELRAQQQREAIERETLEAQGWAEQKDFARALGILEKALQTWPGESRLAELVQKTTAARTAWETDQAIDAVVRECNQLRASHQLAEALEVVQAGLRKYQQAPALVTLEKEVREEWERQQRAEAIARSAEDGQRLLDSGRFQQAVQSLEKACEQYRDESHLQTLLSRAKEELRAQQQRDAVEQVAREAQKWTAKNDFKRALEILQKALESWPGDGRLEELLQATKMARAAREHQQAVDAVVRKCNQLRTNRLAEAMEVIQAALAKYEREPVLVALQTVLREQGELQRRAEAVQRSVEEGQRLLSQGQSRLAVETLEKASGQYGDAAELRALLARAQQQCEAVEKTAIEAQGRAQQQEYGRAIEILHQALQSWPGEPQLAALLQTITAAKSAAEREQLERQRRAEAVRRDAEQGQRLLDESRFQEALELLEKACGREPGAGELQTLLNRARVELEAQNRRQAVEQTAREAERWADQHDFKRALQVLEKALQSLPGESLLEELRQKTTVAGTAWERNQAVAAMVQECNQLIAGGRLAKAEKAIRAGLLKYPQEPALVQLQQSLLAKPESEQRDRPEQSTTPAATRLPAISRSRIVAIGLGLVVLLAAALFAPRLFKTSRGPTVTFTSNIDGAAILLANNVVGDKSCVLPNCTLTLPAGAYKLTATKDGFKALSQTISLQRNSSELKIPLVFEPLPQLVQVNTNFASGRVILDDRPAEELRDGQFTLSGVSPGTHTLRITAGDAQFETEWRNTIGGLPELQRPITANNVQATVIANVGQKGMIACDCDPTTIKVDGNALASASSGAQALRVTDLKEGARRITIGDRSLVVDVKPNPSLNVFLALDRDVGTLVIETGEDGVKVYIDGHGQFRRLTEHGLVRIPMNVGRYTIRVAKDGFRTPAAQTVDLAKGEDKQLAFMMGPLPPVLEIAGALPGVQVSVDGRVIGETGSNGALRTEVSPGNHVVELTKQDYTQAHFSSEFAPGRTTRPSRSQLAMTRAAKPASPPPATTAELKPTEAQDWDRVRNSNNPDELDDFIRKHPGGANVEEARGRLAQLRAQMDAAAARQAEQTAWNGIDKNNKAALQDFLSRYGAGSHAQDARGLIAGIEKQEADAIAAAQRLKDQKPKEPDQAPAASPDFQSIERTLSAYEAAYNAKDLKSLESVWQGMPKSMADATRREFGDAKAISFQIRPLEKPTINGDSATVNCTRTLSLTMKNGRAQDMAGERVRVKLGRSASGWLIQSITPY